MIELRDLTKRFGDHVAVADLDLTVARGELLVLVGTSGCGKTTTLKMINRLIEPSGGTVRIAGRDVRERPAHALRRSVGYAFQRIGLFPHMTVAENVAVTPRLLGWDRARVERRVETLLGLVELDPERHGERFPAELSGGQRQRVGLARALAAEPEILLLDEPFGALDPPTRDRLQRWLGEVRARLDLTVVFVTHDMVEALVLGDRIAVMRDGALVQVGSPAELIRAPADAYVADLLETPRRQTARIEHLLETDGDR